MKIFSIPLAQINCCVAAICVYWRSLEAMLRGMGQSGCCIQAEGIFLFLFFFFIVISIFQLHNLRMCTCTTAILLAFIVNCQFHNNKVKRNGKLKSVKGPLTTSWNKHGHRAACNPTCFEREFTGDDTWSPFGINAEFNLRTDVVGTLIGNSIDTCHYTARFCQLYLVWKNHRSVELPSVLLSLLFLT